MNGKGMPLTGKIPAIDPMFIKACSVIQNPMPQEINLSEGLSIFLIIEKTRWAKSKNKLTSKKQPRKPVSSA
jgi:hypothetical protein